MIVVAGSGKLSGHVFARNRAGAYARTKVSPVNPRTVDQQNSRNRFTAISQAWRGLDANQRAGWDGAVQDYAKTDIFGDLKNPSGFNLFQRLNNNLLNIGEALVEDCPAAQSVPAFDSLALTCVTGTPAMTIAFAPAIPATVICKVFATPPVSQGKSFVRSQYRQIGTIDTTFSTGNSLKTLYDAKFGAPTENGVKIFVWLVPVVIATGQAGVGIADSTITVTS